MKRWLLILCLVSLLLRGIDVRAAEITAVTEDYPPYNYVEKETGEIIGFSTEIVKAVAHKVGANIEIRMLPWARAYDIALNEKNILIYSITRTPQREALFKWVGSIAPINFYFFKLKGRNDIRVNALDDAKKYLIGIVRDGVEMQYLQSKGFGVKEWEIGNKHDFNIRKLIQRRLDLLIFDEVAFAHKIKQLGYRRDDFEKVFYIQEASSELYMAFSNETSDEVVGQFRKGLEKLKSEGTYDEIIRKYLK